MLTKKFNIKIKNLKLKADNNSQTKAGKQKSTQTTSKKTQSGRKRAARIDSGVEKLKNDIINGMQEKKGLEIVCLDLRNLKNASTDYFIICHAESKIHVESIARSVEEYVFKEIGEWPHHKEGVANAEWILLDYINAVAHIFIHESRSFYNIERLWADATVQRIASNF